MTNIINSFPVNWYCVSLFNQACYIDENLPGDIKIKYVVVVLHIS